MRARFVAIATASLAVLVVPGLASADRLSSAEVGQLTRGETVVRPQTMQTGDGRRYVGGVTYTVLEASSSELMALFDDDHAYLEVLPRTKFAQRLATRGADSLIELHQGNNFVDAAYVLHLRKEPERGRVRFWLDPSRPHAIDDAWGFFRIETMDARPTSPRTLLVYGALVDLGASLVRDLYEERVRRAVLAVPQLVRKYMARSAARALPSASGAAGAAERN